MIEMRKRREQEKFREKQAARQRLIDRQVERLEQMKNEEDLRITNQIKEAEKKQIAMMMKREKKRQDLRDEMDYYTTLYHNRKAEE